MPASRTIAMLTTRLLVAGILALITPPRLYAGNCRIDFLPSVEVGREELSLADLLDPASCEDVVRESSHVILGRSPRRGNVRVLTRDDVRQWLLKAAIVTPDSAAVHVPERVSVHRAAPRSSCAEIRARVLAAMTSAAPQFRAQPDGASENRPSFQTDCGAAESVPPDAPLEITRTVWNRPLALWELSVRCVRRSDCVPFLIRVARPSGFPNREIQNSATPTLVKAGQSLTLDWDENGIRILTRVISLDGGEVGGTIRARLPFGGRIVKATIVSAGLLRTPA